MRRSWEIAGIHASCNVGSCLDLTDCSALRFRVKNLILDCMNFWRSEHKAFLARSVRMGPIR